MMYRRKNYEREKRKTKKKIEKFEVMAFITMGFAVASGFANAVYRTFEFDRNNRDCKTKEFYKESECGFILRSSNRKDCSCEVERNEIQVCKKEHSISVPYELEYVLKTDEDSENKKFLFEFDFENLDDRKILNFEVIFFVFDENGEPPLYGKNYEVLSVKEEVGGNSKMKYSCDISDFFEFDPDLSYNVDFVYVSKITYDDGEVWKNDVGHYV